MCTREDLYALKNFRPQQILDAIRAIQSSEILKVINYLKIEKLWKGMLRPTSDNVLVVLTGSRIAEDQVVDAAEKAVQIWLRVGPGLTEELLIELLAALREVERLNVPEDAMTV